jgi:hypothetical protein
MILFHIDRCLSFPAPEVADDGVEEEDTESVAEDVEFKSRAFAGKPVIDAHFIC